MSWAKYDFFIPSNSQWRLLPLTFVVFSWNKTLSKPSIPQQGVASFAHRHCKELLLVFHKHPTPSFDIWESQLPHRGSDWVSECGSCYETCCVTTGSIDTSCRNGPSISAIVQWVKQIRKEKEIAAAASKWPYGDIFKMHYSTLLCALCGLPWCQNAQGCS